MTCPKCNFQNPEGAFICQKCQAVLAVPKPPPAPIAEVGPMAAAGQVSIPEIPTVNPLKKWLWVWVVVAGLILILAVAAVMAIRSKPDSAGGTAPSAAISPAPTSGFSSFTEPSAAQAPKTKYDIDSDGDAIPDFVETAIGFDPNYNNALTCVKKSCEAPGQQTAQSTQTNILFILDASGSMAESISGGVKMDLAKQSLKKYAESLPTETNVGLMVYGHKGSNNAKDKAVSCAGIETVYPMGEMNKSAFEAVFSKFSPTGWTVIGGALRKSANEFTGKDGQNNHVIVISDGIETCGSDPAGAAKELKNLSINPQIDVIGLAVDAAARTQLEEVAKIGGGTYKPANSGLELEDALKKTIEAARQSLVCSFKTSTAYQNCLILEQYRPASQYLQNLQLQALKNKDMEEEAAIRGAKSRLLDYWDQLYSQDVTVSTKANLELYRQYEELRR